MIVRIAGVDPAAARDEISTEEIRELVVAQRGFTAQQRDIISGAFEITERVVREILIPRNEVTTLNGQHVRRRRRCGLWRSQGTPGHP